MAKYINDNPIGKDSIIGGVFFGGDMIPSGLFNNVPKYHKIDMISKQEPKLLLTLNKVKFSLNNSLKKEKGYEIDDSNDVNLFLENLVNLLVDYKDLRNYIFYGSANTEVAYNINKLIETYPYRTLVAEENGTSDITLSNTILDGENHTQIVFPYYNNNNKGTDRIIRDNWNKFVLDDMDTNLDVSNLQIIDRLQRKFDIKKVVTPYQNKSNQMVITDIANHTKTIGSNTFNSIKVTTLQPLNLEDTTISFDKIFVNGSLKSKFFLYFSSKAENMLESRYEIYESISTNEFLIRRVGNVNPYENINIDYTIGDVFGGGIKFLEETTIHTISDISNTTIGSESFMTIGFNGGIQDGVNYQTSTNYKIGQKIKFFEFYNLWEESNLKFRVINSTGEIFDYNLNDKDQTFIISNFVHFPNLSDRRLDEYKVMLERDIKEFAVEKLSYIDITPTSFSGMARLFPSNMNGEKFWVKIIVKGILNYEDLINYKGDNFTYYNGFLISPNLKTISNFEKTLTPLQKFLLSPIEINKTNWPRRNITNNIMNIVDENYIDTLDYNGENEIDFYNWLNNPNLLYNYEFGDEVENDLYSNNLFYEYQLARTLYSDETVTNQLIRRAIPTELINEIYDPEFYFGRFVLMAGWLFDQIKTYVDFIKYTHTLNYGEYNQLNPEFYKYYADQLGIELYEDEEIDFAKLIIQTEPGFYYSNDKNYEENKFFRETLIKIQYERQKRLLISLLYLYSIKGTKECVEKMVSLLGAPEGLLVMKEYAFKVNNLNFKGIPTNTFKGNKIVDNEKIHTPDFSFEIDVDCLKDKNNVSNPINKPYVYKKVYTNDYTYNLREVSVNTDANAAIDKHIDNNYGEMKFNYIKFNKGEFSTLQKNEGYLLPLTFPDKYYGFSVEYMIPKEGYSVLTNNNYDEATFNLLNLYEVKDVEYKSIHNISNISINDSMTEVIIETDYVNDYEVGNRVFVFGSEGIIGFDKEYTIREILSSTKFKVTGSFRRDMGLVLVNGSVTMGGLDKLISLNDVSYTYPLPANFNERNHIEDYDTLSETLGNPLTDFNILKRIYPNSEFDASKQYILTRIEGHDLVFRIRLKSEIDGHYEERVAIFQNIVNNDGLNHSLRFTFTSNGVEIFKDYKYIGVAKWVNHFIHSLTPYLAYECPKKEILDRVNATNNCVFDYYENLTDLFSNEITYNNLGLDKLKWWDMFIGMPNNLNVLIKKINIYENVTINDYNIGDKITDIDLKTAEAYIFQVASVNENNSSGETDYIVPATFYTKNPNNIIDFYGYKLETILDDYNRNVIDGLSLTNKKTQLLEIDTISKISNYKQDFFRNKEYFDNNAWVKTIHSDYEYKLFNGNLHELYYLYSNQTLTYKAMEEFLGLVENKFRNLILNFIPIVIDISNFGTLYANSKYQISKMRYNNKFCEGIHLQLESFVLTNVFKRNTSDLLLDEGVDFNYELIYDGVEILHSDLIEWNTNRITTLNDLSLSLNNYIIAEGFLGFSTVHSETLRVAINKESFYDLTGKDIQKVEIVLNGLYRFRFSDSIFPIMDVIEESVNPCGSLVIESGTKSDSCGFYKYELPHSEPNPLYVWYKSEEMKKTNIFYKSEDSIVKKTTKFKEE